MYFSSYGKVQEVRISEYSQNMDMLFLSNNLSFQIVFSHNHEVTVPQKGSETDARELMKLEL